MIQGMILGALLYHIAREVLARYLETADLLDEMSAHFTEEIQRLQGKPPHVTSLSEWLDREAHADPPHRVY